VECIEAAIAPFFLGLSKSEFFTAVSARNMLGYPLSTVDDLVADEQLAARGFWQPIDSAWDGEVCVPGSFALFDGQRPEMRRTAPGVGEHNLEIYRDELGLGADEVTALRSSGVL
jgi:benzylsuccinate CoA-transferase BbsE subunit